MKTNAQHAFDQYVMWLRSYPGDYQGATAAASDFLEDQGDIDELTRLIKDAGNTN
jgi:hypothetical protein